MGGGACWCGSGLLPCVCVCVCGEQGKGGEGEALRGTDVLLCLYMWHGAQRHVAAAERKCGVRAEAGGGGREVG